MTDDHTPPPEPAHPQTNDRSEPGPAVFTTDDVDFPEPINWNTLPPEDAEIAWAELDAWVSWLRTAYGLSVLEIPPFWHRHDELVWELSALHLHWLACYGDGASPSAPLQFHKDLHDARARLREWVAACGTQATSDRPTTIATWPGEPAQHTPPARHITDRDADFRQMVTDDVHERQSVADRHRRTAKPHPRAGA
jgi:hypothetical protein